MTRRFWRRSGQLFNRRFNHIHKRALVAFAVSSPVIPSETATQIWGWTIEQWFWFSSAVGALSLGALAVAINPIIGNFVHKELEEFDVDILGVDIHITEVEVNIWKGIFKIKGIKLDNPPDFSDPYILTADEIIVDFDMSQFFQKKLEIELIRFENVNVYYEDDNLLDGLEGSNIQWLLNFLYYADPEGHKPDEAPPTPITPEDRTYVQDLSNELYRSFYIDKIQILNANAHVRSKQVSLPDIKFDDFFGEHGDAYLQDVVKTLLQSICNSTLKHLSFWMRFN